MLSEQAISADDTYGKLNKNEKSVWSEFKRQYLSDAPEDGQDSFLDIKKKTQIYKKYHTQEQLDLLADLAFSDKSLEEFIAAHVANDLPPDERREALKTLNDRVGYACSAMSNFIRPEDVRRKHLPMLNKISEEIFKKWVVYRDLEVERLKNSTTLVGSAVGNGDDTGGEEDAESGKKEIDRRIREHILKSEVGNVVHHAFLYLEEFTRDAACSSNIDRLERRLRTERISETRDGISATTLHIFDHLLQSVMFTHNSPKYLAEKAAEEQATGEIKKPATFRTHLLASVKSGFLDVAMKRFRLDSGRTSDPFSERNITEYKMVSLSDTPFGNDSDRMPPTFGDMIIDKKNGPSDARAITRDWRAAFMKAISQLGGKECEVIYQRFGFNPTNDSQNLEEIGYDMRITRERVRQIEGNALRKLLNVLPEDLLETSSEDLIRFNDLFDKEAGSDSWQLNKRLIIEKPRQALRAVQREIWQLLGEGKLDDKVQILSGSNNLQRNKNFSAMLVQDALIEAGRGRIYDNVLTNSRTNAMNHLQSHNASSGELQKLQDAFAVLDYIYNNRASLKARMQRQGHAPRSR